MAGSALVGPMTSCVLAGLVVGMPEGRPPGTRVFYASIKQLVGGGSAARVPLGIKRASVLAVRA